MSVERLVVASLLSVSLLVDFQQTELVLTRSLPRKSLLKVRKLICFSKFFESDFGFPDFPDLLNLMGIGKTPETPLKEKPRVEIEKSKKVQFIEPEVAKKPPSPAPQPAPGTNGRQIVPGLLLVSSSTESFMTPSKPVTTPAKVSSSQSDDSLEKVSTSPSSTASNQDSGIGESGASTRDQLAYLAQLIGFTVSYSDFPKGNHKEFLSLVTLSTDPPQMSHGSGSSVDESRDHAAMKALSVLSELGLDNVKPKAK